MDTKSLVPETWKSKHLFVLVGGNPLPSYVAAQTLLTDGGTLHLVHSPEVAETAERIGNLCEAQFVRHTVQARDSRNIEQVVRQAVASYDDLSIGLNYTGGTKAMAVHAHRAVKQARPDALCTYLDAQTLSMHRDDTGQSLPVQYTVQPKIEILLELHDIHLKTGRIQESPSHFKFARRIGEAFAANKATPDAYERWCSRYLQRTSLSDGCKQALVRLVKIVEEDGSERNDELLAEIRSSPELTKKKWPGRASHFFRTPVPFPTDPALQNVAQALREWLNTDEDGFDPDTVVARFDSFRKIEHLVKYLHGEWPEDLVLGTFDQLKDECNLHDLAMTLDTDPNRTDKNFEFDVAVMQGYRLFAVSCTRSAETDLCKKKLFEAYIRASLLGGDETRVGLVCAHESPSSLQQEVIRDLEADSDRLRVFGRKDLADLRTAFRDWLS